MRLHAEDALGRGELLWEQPWSEAKRKEAQHALSVRTIGLLVVIASLILGLMGMLLLFQYPSICASVSLIWLIVAAVLIAATWLSLEEPRPERIYEKGFTEVGFLGQERFVPWAALTGWREVAHVEVGPPRSGGKSRLNRRVKVTMKVRGSGDRTKVITPNRKNAHLIRQSVRLHAGKADQVPRSYEQVLRWEFLRHAAIAMMVAIGLGLLFAAMLSPIQVVLGSTTSGIILGALAAVPLLFAFLLWMFASTGWGLPGGPFPHLVIAIAIGLMLMLANVAISHYGLESLDYDRHPFELPYPGSSTMRLGEHRNETIALSDPISVVDGMHLLLENCTVTFTPPRDEDFGIWVEEGASLVMRNTTIRSGEGSYAIIEVHGSALIEDCRLEHLGGEPGFSRLDGCVRLFSDDIAILDTNITWSDGDGIVMSDCSPQIRGCVIDGVWQDAIVCYGGRPNITDCSVMGAERGLVLEDSDARVFGCEVRSAHIGIVIVSASPTIEGCAVQDCWGMAATYDSLSDPRFANISLTGNGAGLVEQRWTDLDTHPLAMQLGDLCMPTYIVIGVLCAALTSSALLGVQRRARRLIPSRRVGAVTWVDQVGPSRLEMGAFDPARAIPAGLLSTSPWRNRGEVLWRASPSQAVRERLRVEMPLLLAFGPMVVVMPFLFTFRPSEAVAVSLAALLGFAAVASLPFWWAMGRTYRAVEVYEHGVSVAAPYGRWRFIQWIVFKEAIETVPSDAPRRVTLSGRDVNVQLEESSEGYETARDFAFERMGRRGQDRRDPWDRPARRFQAEYHGLMAVMLGISLTTVCVALSDGVDSPSLGLPAAHLVAVLGALVVGTPFLVIWLTNYLYEPGYSAEARRVARRLAVGGLIVFVAFGIVFVASYTAMTETRMVPVKDDDPGASWLAPGDYRGEAMTVEGPIVVHDGESLSIEDCTLTLDPGSGAYRGIWVGRGGQLNIINATVRAANPTAGFAFEVHGSAVIDGCLIVGTEAKPWIMDRYELDSGLEMYSSAIRVTNSSFLGAHGNAISVHGCSPLISGCRMEGMEEAGVEVVEGDPTIEGCWIGGGYEGISLHHSEARVKDCTILANRVGITMRYSDPRVERCVFENNTDAAVQYWTSESEPRFDDNAFNGDGPRLVVEPRHGSPWGYLFIIYMVPLLFMGSVVGTKVWEHEERPPFWAFVLGRPVVRWLLGRPPRRTEGPIVTFCPRCGHRMMVSDVRRPNIVRCPECQETWTVVE